MKIQTQDPCFSHKSIYFSALDFWETSREEVMWSQLGLRCVKRSKCCCIPASYSHLWWVLACSLTVPHVPSGSQYPLRCVFHHHKSCSQRLDVNWAQHPLQDNIFDWDNLDCHTEVWMIELLNNQPLKRRMNFDARRHVFCMSAAVWTLVSLL